MGQAASVASTGLAAIGHVMQGYGTQSADEFKAQQAQRAAEIGRMHAMNTDITMREKSNIVLGNIEAIRAAGNVDPTSPTTAALLDRERMAADRARMAAVGSQRMQASEDAAAAAYLRKAGDFAVTMGYLGGATDLLGGIGKAFTSPVNTAGGGPSPPASFSLTNASGLY